MCSCTISLTSAFDGGVVKATRRPPDPQERDKVPTVQEAGRVPGPVWTGEENLAPTGIFFYIVLYSLSVIRTCVFVLLALHFDFLSLLTTHNPNIHVPGGTRTRNLSK